jgi:hypothetical protein
MPVVGKFRAEAAMGTLVQTGQEALYGNPGAKLEIRNACQDCRIKNTEFSRYHGQSLF